MQAKDKKPAPKKPATKTTVTRIKAGTPKPAVAKTTAPKKATKKPAQPKKSTTLDEDANKNIFRAIGGYFAGAWYELKQVNWPNRRATWSLTGAMIAFTGFFVVVILLLDALFKYLFEIMLG